MNPESPNYKAGNLFLQTLSLLLRENFLLDVAHLHTLSNLYQFVYSCCDSVTFQTLKMDHQPVAQRK